MIVMKKKVVCVLLAGILTVGVTACSWSKDAVKMHEGSSSSVTASSDQAAVKENSSDESVSSVSGNSTSASLEMAGTNSESSERTASVSEQNELNLSGDSEGSETEKLGDAFEKCVGWGGSAGSALKSAAAAVGLVEWAADNDGSEEEIADAVKTAWEKLDDEQKENFRENWRGISTNANLMFSDFASVKDVFSDSGVLDRASEAVEKHDAQQKWEVLRQKIVDVM
jgi:hypothetical protein